MFTPEIVNVGALPNDGEGDPLRVAFEKINNNFSTLSYTAASTTLANTTGTTANQIIFENPVATFTQGTFQIKSYDGLTTDSQDIIISAQLTNNSEGVRFTAYGTTFEGNAVCRYDMDVSSSNVRILCSPLINTTLTHFIASQITYTEPI